MGLSWQSALLLFYLGSHFLLYSPEFVHAEPNFEDSVYRAYNTTRNATGRWWNNTRGYFNPNSPGYSGQSYYGNPSHPYRNFNTSRPSYSFNASRIATGIKGFSNHLWNRTSDYISPKNKTSNFREKSQKWWQSFKNFWSRKTTTPRPPIAWQQVPLNNNQQYSSAYWPVSKTKRGSDPAESGESRTVQGK